jgi:tRNA(Ile)-lysidine synthase
LDPPGGWTVRARRRGDRIRPQADGPSRKLKQFFQDAAIPPWLRVFVPVLEWDGEAVALGDWVIGQRLRTWLRENGLTYHWEPTHAVLIRVRNESQNG